MNSNRTGSPVLCCAIATCDLAFSLKRPSGATVLDEPCVIDGNLITARFPYDLPRLIKALAQQLVAAKG